MPPLLFDVNEDQLYDDIEDAYDTKTAEAADRYFHNEVHSFLRASGGIDPVEEDKDVEAAAMEYFGQEPWELADEQDVIEERIELYTLAVEAWASGGDPREVDRRLRDPETYMESVEQHIDRFLGQEFDPQDHGQVLDLRDRSRAAYEAGEEPEALREGVQNKLRHGAAGKARARQALYDVVTTGNESLGDARDSYRELSEAVMDDVRTVVQDAHDMDDINFSRLVGNGSDTESPDLAVELEDRGYAAWEAEEVIGRLTTRIAPE